MERMKKKKKVIAGFLLAMLLIPQYAYADSLDMKVISVNMPDIRIYLEESSEDVVKDELKLYLNDDKLNVTDIMPFSDLEEGIEYYFLMDTSTSISSAYFQGMKDGLIKFISKLDEKDRITIVTFGAKIKTLYKNVEKDETTFEKVKNLQNAENQTHLFEAMTQIAKQANDGSDLRKIMILLSDGEDVAIGSNNKAEAVSAVKNAGIGFYCLTIEPASESYVNSNAEMTRLLGGANYIIGENPADVEERLIQIKKALNAHTVVQASAQTNRIPSPFVITLDYDKKGYVPSKDTLEPVRYKKDTEPPVIEEVEKTSEHQLAITFSEDVLGADELENYSVTVNGGQVVLTGASYSRKNYTAVLKTKEKIAGGEYVITANAICDNSLEQNELQEYKGDVEGQWYFWFVIKKFLNQYWWAVAVFLFAAIVASALVIIRKNKGFITVEGKLVYGKNVKKKYHIEEEIKDPLRQRAVKFLIQSDGKKAVEVDYVIDKSVIMGRAAICEIRFDDPSMSRQHLCIEVRNGELFVSDLGTANGTIINGLKIASTRKLADRDTITAGRTNITIRWQEH